MLLRFLSFINISSLFALTACSQSVGYGQSPEVAGTTFEVRVAYESKTEGGASTGSSRGHSTLIERVLKVNEGGVLLEYDFTDDTSEEQRLKEWRYPARLHVKSDGTVELENAGELETRNIDWRNHAGVSDNACGLWYFTWNAFKVECDPHSVIDDLESFRLHSPAINEGALLVEPGTIRPQQLSKTGEAPFQFQAVFELDPNKVRNGRAEEDVIVAQIMSDDELSIEDAIAERSSEEISGTLTTSLVLDDLGRIVERTRLSSVTVRLADGTSERLTNTETTTRTQISE